MCVCVCSAHMKFIKYACIDEKLHCIETFRWWATSTASMQRIQHIQTTNETHDDNNNNNKNINKIAQYTQHIGAKLIQTRKRSTKNWYGGYSHIKCRSFHLHNTLGFLHRIVTIGSFFSLLFPLLSFSFPPPPPSLALFFSLSITTTLFSFLLCALLRFFGTFIIIIIFDEYDHIYFFKLSYSLDQSCQAQKRIFFRCMYHQFFCACTCSI